MKPPARIVGLLAFALLPGCKDEAPSPIEIPSEVHGSFGRTADDLHHGTHGLEVDGTSMRFSEMTMVVTDGKMVGDTFQIGRAEVRWKKDDPEKLPKECKGTLARQGDRLLVTLFKVDSDEPCESILKGDWTQWKEVTEIPEWMRGTYGSSDPYDPEPGVSVDAKTLGNVSGGDRVELVSGYHFVGKQDQLFVTEAKLGEGVCKGTITLVDDELGAALSATTDDGWCPMFGGHRWTVDTPKIPTGKLTNGKVTLAFDGDTVTVTNEDSPPLTCTQKIVRTSTRSTTDKSLDNLTVLAGQVLTLASASPSAGQDSGKKRMQNLMVKECEELGAGECDAAAFADIEVECPTHIVVGDPSGGSRKVALLPNDVKLVACYDTTGQFEAK